MNGVKAAQPVAFSEFTGLLRQFDSYNHANHGHPEPLEDLDCLM